MNRLLALGIALLICAPAMAQSTQKNITIVGDVIDLVSYVTGGTKPTTPEGKEIFEQYIKAGSPVGIVSKSNGKVYLATMKESGKKAADVLIPFVGMKIAATGDLYIRGNARVFVITSVGKSVK